MSSEKKSVGPEELASPGAEMERSASPEEIPIFDELVDAEEVMWKKTGVVPAREKTEPVRELGYPQWRETGSGTITYLRVCFNDQWGGGLDVLRTEVIVKHSAVPDKAFGFYLRPDKKHLAANLAMVSTLRDSIAHNIPVSIGYWVRQIWYDFGGWYESKNCKMERVSLVPTP